MKKYFDNLLHLCSDEQFGQDAVEWAITTGLIKLTYELETDLRLIVGEPGKPETGKYPELVEAYQGVIRQEWTDGDAELLEEILRAV